MKFKAFGIVGIEPISASNTRLMEIDVLMVEYQYVELMQALCEQMGDDRFLAEAKKIAEQ